MNNRHSLLIGTLGFGKDDFFYGLELCLSLAGVKHYSVTPTTAKAFDVILITMFWYRDIYNLELFLRKSGIRKGGKPIFIAGGMHVTMSPLLVAELVDYCFIGDADDALGEILDQIARGDKPEHKALFSADMEIIPKSHECTPLAYAMRKGGKYDVVRCEIARGCRYHCSFCAISRLKPYCEVDADAIIKLIQDIPEKTVSLFAPERTMHSRWKEIQAALIQAGKHDLGQDVRLEHITEVAGNIVTLGIEGISYRLRKSVKKAFKQEYIIQRMKEFIESRARICHISAYFIADLPNEDESDWEELYGLFENIERENFSRFLVFKPILNPLSPRPFTDLASTEIHPFRDYKSRWQKVLRKNGGQWGYRVIESMVWGPFERMMDALATWGGSDAYKIIRKMKSELLRYDIPGSERTHVAHTIIREAVKLGIKEAQLFGPRG